MFSLSMPPFHLLVHYLFAVAKNLRVLPGFVRQRGGILLEHLPELGRIWQAGRALAHSSDHARGFHSEALTLLITHSTYKMTGIIIIYNIREIVLYR